MIDLTFNNLRDYYDKQYSIPSTDSEAIKIILEVYEKEMGNITPAIKNGISEVYRELLGKGLPSYYWMLEAIHRTSKKKESKKSFPYIVGTLRNWSLYGFGNTLTNEEEEIYDYFTEITGLKITPDSRLLLSSIMGTFGAFKLMRTLPELKNIDLSVIVVEMLGRLMKEKYEPKSEPVRLAIIETATTKQLPSAKQKKTPLSNDTNKAIKEIVELLSKSEKPLRPTDIANHLSEKGFTRFNQKNMTSNLLSFMNNEPKIVKIGIGQYWHRDKVSNNGGTNDKVE